MSCLREARAECVSANRVKIEAARRPNGTMTANRRLPPPLRRPSSFARRLRCGRGPTPVAVGARLAAGRKGRRTVLRPLAVRGAPRLRPGGARSDRRRYAGSQFSARSLGRPGRGGNAAAIVKAFRFGLFGAGQVAGGDRSRRGRPVRPRSNRSRSSTGARPSRLKIELKPCDRRRIRRAAARAAATTRRRSRGPQPPPPRPVIVLDPGHGGVRRRRPRGRRRRRKDAGLAFCDELKRQLEATRRYSIVMTRDRRRICRSRRSREHRAPGKRLACSSRSTPTRSARRRTSAGRPSTPSPTAPPTPRRRASPRAKTPPTEAAGSEKQGAAGPRRRRHLVRSEAARDPRLRPYVLARPGRRTCARRPGSTTIRSVRRVLSSSRRRNFPRCWSNSAISRTPRTSRR